MHVLLQEFTDSPDFLVAALDFMPYERCAKLMAVGMANNLDEVWISGHPFLLATYMRQYLPNLFSW